MSSPIDGYVTGLNDFPLDPNSGNAWLWTADGTELLWVSSAAGTALGLNASNLNTPLLTAERFRGLAADLASTHPDQQPVRAQQITLRNGSIAKGFTCLSRPVQLRSGGYGILAVAIGAASRKPEIQDNRPTAPNHETIQQSAPHLEPQTRPRRSFRLGHRAESDTGAAIEELRHELVQALKQQALKQQDTQEVTETSLQNLAPDNFGTESSMSELTSRRSNRDAIPDTGQKQASTSIAPPDQTASSTAWAPNWAELPLQQRTPKRFVWQTDAAGRFVHLSRELSEAVGPSHALLLGQTIMEAATRLHILEVDDIAKGLANHETWTARAALWPVEGADVGVPVELAGMPVLEQGQFAGFRGYGIARIERAVTLPNTAAEALAQDTTAQKTLDAQQAHSHFGPAVERALERSRTAFVPETANKTESEIRTSSLVSKAETTNPLPVRAGKDASQNPVTDRAEPAAISVPPSNNAPFNGIAKATQTPQTQAAEEQHRSGLSSSEREAFREIARALEKSEGLKENLAAKTQTVLRTNNDAVDTSEVDQASQAVKAGSLQALKKDLAKRSKLRLGASSSDEPKPTAAAASHAPVVSYGELRARRELKERHESSQDANRAPWATIMDRLPIGLLVSQNGNTLYANRYLLELTGFPDFDSFREEMEISSLFAGNEGGQSNKIVEAKSADIASYAIKTRKGETRKVEASIQSTVWDETPATLTCIRPVPEGTGAQFRALELDLLSARSELYELQSILDTATDGILSIDAEGRILGMNRSAEALFGFDQNELIGEPMTVLFEPESHIAALDYLEGLKSNGVRSIMNDGRDMKGRERNGGILPLFMTIGRIGENHMMSRFCVVLRDITHWKKVEKDLLEAKRIAEDSSTNKTDFLAAISHEIRTPLNAIIGFSQVMMTESFGPIGNERYKQYAKDIHSSGEHVVSLVNDLLDLSKVASGKLELTFASVDINAIVASCVAMIQPQANAGKVIVRSQLSSHLPQVVADERAVRQIVINLLSNAAKFTDAGGQVIASTTFTDQGEVLIRVRDTGIGMSEDEIKRAMEPFRQISGPRNGGGTGLGLPLTKALVEANRASFSIHSGQQQGTLVEVTFPSTRVLAE